MVAITPDNDTIDPRSTRAAVATAGPGSGAAPVPPAPPPRRAVTRRLYAADWRHFVEWCRHRRQAALPAAPATVAAYLAALAPTLQHGALGRRAAAIADRHRRQHVASPGADPAVRLVLREARAATRAADRPSDRASGRAEAGEPGSFSRPRLFRRQPPPAPAQLQRMAARCPGDLAGLRDRALLLLTASGTGGERLLALDRERVRFTRFGVELAWADSEPSDAGGITFLARGPAPAACPARALEEWLRSSDTRFGPVFRKVDRWGNVEHRRLRPDGLRRIWARRAAALRPGPHPPESAPKSVPESAPA